MKRMLLSSFASQTDIERDLNLCAAIGYHLDPSRSAIRLFWPFGE
jgi:hypothetical protein